MSRCWRTRRTWMIELGRYNAGELRLDQISDDALCLMAQRAAWRDGDTVVLEHDDGHLGNPIIIGKKEEVS